MDKTLNECGRKQSCPNLRYYPGFLGQNWRKPPKKLKSELLVSSDRSVHWTSWTWRSATTSQSHPRQFPTEWDL